MKSHPWHSVVVALVLLTPPLSAQTTAAAGWNASPATQLKGALRTLAAAQGRYKVTRGTYASAVTPLQVAADPGVRLDILAATPTGWQARAVHRDRPGLSCVIFVGRIAGVEAPRTDGDREMAGEDGVPLCDRMR